MLIRDRVRIQREGQIGGSEMEIDREEFDPDHMPDRFDGEFVDLEGPSACSLVGIGVQGQNDVMYLNSGRHGYRFRVYPEHSRKFQAESMGINPNTGFRPTLKK